MHLENVGLYTSIIHLLLSLNNDKSVKTRIIVIIQTAFKIKQVFELSVWLRKRNTKTDKNKRHPFLIAYRASDPQKLLAFCAFSVFHMYFN